MFHFIFEYKEMRREGGGEEGINSFSKLRCENSAVRRKKIKIKIQEQFSSREL